MMASEAERYAQQVIEVLALEQMARGSEALSLPNSVYRLPDAPAGWRASGPWGEFWLEVASDGGMRIFSATGVVALPRFFVPDLIRSLWRLYNDPANPIRLGEG